MKVLKGLKVNVFKKILDHDCQHSFSSNILANPQIVRVLMKGCFFPSLITSDNVNFQGFHNSFSDNHPVKLTDEELGNRFENLTGRKATSMQKSDVIYLSFVDDGVWLL